MFTKLCYVLLFCAAPAFAGATVTITKAQSPASPGLTGVAYFTALSTESDAITSATSDCCTAVELHEHTMDGNVMRMRRVEEVSLPAGKPVIFAPHGLHVMLIGMKTASKSGQVIPITLHFKHAAPQQIRITVQK